MLLLFTAQYVSTEFEYGGPSRKRCRTILGQHCVPQVNMGVKSCQSTDNAQPTGFYYVYFQSDGFLIPQVNPLYVTNTVLPAIADSLSYSPLSICIYIYIYIYIVCTHIYNIYSYIYIFILYIYICHLTCHCFVSACGLTSVVRPGCNSLQS